MQKFPPSIPERARKRTRECMAPGEKAARLEDWDRETIMGNVPQLNNDDTLRVPPAVANGIGLTYGSLRSTFATMPAGSKLMQIGYSFADQALAVGGTFLANVVLA